SKPTFDPNLFVDGIDTESWQALNESPDKPLLNRALRGTYPPGSAYKPFMAMAALHTGKRAASTLINDPLYFMFGGRRFGSPENEKGGIMDMNRSIVESSNVYYYSLANEMGVDAIHDFMKPLGFGQITGIDINGEVRGILPSQDWKRRYFKKPEAQKWFAGETISLGIGQGYNSFTMLQMAQATAALVNNGIKHKPRLVIGTLNSVTRSMKPLPLSEPENLGYNPEHVAVIRKALVGVTLSGTSAKVFAGAEYLSGGKTGTAQAVALSASTKYNSAKLEESQRDHSLYVAMAPADDPKIAIAVIVENAGWGSAAAAPLARRAFDYMLLGQYPSEEDMAAVKLGQAGAPIGKPRRAADVTNLLPGGASVAGLVSVGKPTPPVAVATPEPKAVKLAAKTAP
ncbi:MAG: penicillin-binding protein 2, partial [Polaromonas sp.]|nr:penicillin-binding protein 2 [Polaromonas sp.]